MLRSGSNQRKFSIANITPGMPMSGICISVSQIKEKNAYGLNKRLNELPYLNIEVKGTMSSLLLSFLDGEILRTGSQSFSYESTVYLTNNLTENHSIVALQIDSTTAVEATKFIFRSLPKFINLKLLSIHQSKFDDLSLAKYISSTRSLEILKISSYHYFTQETIHPRDVKHLSRAIVKNQSLKSVYFSLNGNISTLIQALSQHSHLHDVNLACSLNSENIDSLTELIDTSQSIKSLSIRIKWCNGKHKDINFENFFVAVANNLKIDSIVIELCALNSSVNKLNLSHLKSLIENTYNNINKTISFEAILVISYRNSDAEFFYAVNNKKFSLVRETHYQYKSTGWLDGSGYIIPGEGENINERGLITHDVWGNTALHDGLHYYATSERDIRELKAIVDSGIDITRKNSQGMTPLSLADKANNGRIVKILKTSITFEPSAENAQPMLCRPEVRPVHLSSRNFTNAENTISLARRIPNNNTTTKEVFEKLRETTGNSYQQEQPPTALVHLPRVSSYEKAVQLHDMDNFLVENMQIKCIWLCIRSSYHLNNTELKHLNDFKIILQATITSLLAAIKAIDSKKINEKSSTIASVTDSLISLPLGFIPFVGPFLQQACGFLQPASTLEATYHRSQYHQLSKYLHKFDSMDNVSEEFSAVVTSYHYAEIISPSRNKTQFEEFKKYFQPKIFPMIKDYVSWQIKKNITGGDDKIEKPDHDYCEHWDVLIEHIIARFLTNSAEITFEDVKQHTLAIKLSAALTFVSDEPLQFHPNSVDLDLINAFSLSRLALLAYETERKIDELASIWGYEKNVTDRLRQYKFFFKKDMQGFVLADEEKVIICFRGTDTLAATWKDIQFYQSPISHPDIKVHAGFLDGLHMIWDKMKIFIHSFLKKLLDNDKPYPSIWFTGHSLGSALATLAASDFLNEYGSLQNSVHLYTFGQPKCGNQAFADNLDKCIKDYQRFVNYLDPITSVPPNSIFDFAHAGNLRWLNSKGELLDEYGYEEEAHRPDLFNRDTVRNNELNKALHLWNHSMMNYNKKMGDLLNKTYSYAEYVDIQFEQSKQRAQETIRYPRCF